MDKKSRMAHARAVRESKLRELRAPTQRELELRDLVAALKSQLKAAQAELCAEAAAKKARAAHRTIVVPEHLTGDDRRRFIARHKMAQLRTRRRLEATQLELDVAALEEAMTAGSETAQLLQRARARVEELRNERREIGKRRAQYAEAEAHHRAVLVTAPNDLEAHDRLALCLSLQSRDAARNVQITAELRDAHQFLELMESL